MRPLLRQRGGSPSPFDRILGTQLGTMAVDLAVNKEFGYMTGVRKSNFTKVPLGIVTKGARLIPLDHPLIRAARSVGTCFGDKTASCTNNKNRG